MKKAGLNFSFDNYIMKYWNLFNPFYNLNLSSGDVCGLYNEIWLRAFNEFLNVIQDTSVLLSKSSASSRRIKDSILPF